MKQITLLLCLNFMGNFIFAQIQHGGTPISIEKSISKKKKHFELEHYEFVMQKRDSIGPLHVGDYRPINIDVLNDIDSIAIKNKIVYTFSIQSKGAKSVSAYFQKMILSKNTKIYFLTNQNVLGSYNYKNVKTHKNKRFKGPLINGNSFAIQIEIEKEELDKNEIIISDVIHYGVDGDYFYKSIASTDCQIDVNCSEGNEWCNQIRSVAKFLFTRNSCGGGDWICSGALINNSNNDFKQYFLTARHCTNCDIEWETVKFLFNAQRPVCGVGSNSMYSYDDYSIEQGASLNSYCDVSFTDNALIEIIPKIPLQYNIYYSGWDIHEQSLYTNIHIIHLPSSKVKKITSGQIQYYAGHKWDVYWDDGIIEGGSSGAPIFKNDNKKIIATLSGGADYTCENGLWHDWVGKIRDCWNVSSMGEHLANGSTIKELDGIDPILACQNNIELDGDFRDAREYNAAVHQIHLQANNTVLISNDSKSKFRINSNFKITAGERITILPNSSAINSDGTEIVEGAIFSAYIAPCSTVGYCGEENNENANKKELDVTNTLEGKHLKEFSLYPNPYSENFSIAFDLEKQENVTIQISNMLGKIVYEESFKGQKGNQKHLITLEASDKILIAKICIANECYKAKMVKQ